MRMRMRSVGAMLVAAAIWSLTGLVSIGSAVAGDDVVLGEGKMSLIAPDGWVSKEPRTNIVEVEFEIPGVEDKAAGRLTIMAAGGSVEQNVERWEMQFVEGKEATVEMAEMGSVKIHLVDLAGTFKESSGGPLGRVTERPNYRMLGAILQAPGAPTYFIKLTGPAETLAANEEAFKTFVKSVTTPEK